MFSTKLIKPHFLKKMIKQRIHNIYILNTHTLYYFKKNLMSPYVKKIKHLYEINTG